MARSSLKRRRSPHVVARLVAAGALAALGLLAVTASGCNTTACARHSDCDPGLVCSAEGACVERPDAAITVDGPDADLSEQLDAADAAGTDAADAGPAFDAGPTTDAGLPFDAAPAPDASL